MIRFLLRIPRWLSVVLVVFAGAAVFVITRLIKDQAGWQLVGTVATGVVMTTGAVSLPLLLQWQQQHNSSRLQLSFNTNPANFTAPSIEGLSAALAPALEAERAQCLKSLNSDKPITPIRFPELKSAPVAGISLKRWLELEEKQRNGEELTGQEQVDLQSNTNIFKDSIATTQLTIASSLADILNRDRRSPDEYKREVERYIEELDTYLKTAFLRSYANGGHGLFQATVTNDSDKNFEDVEVEAYFPGEISAFRFDQWPVKGQKPNRPRAFGIGTSSSDMFGSLLSPVIKIPSGLIEPVKPLPDLGPKIDNSGSARIKYPSFNLRPRSEYNLPFILLIVRERLGSVTEATWTATAKNADGKLEDRFRVGVLYAPLPFGEILADSLAKLNDSQAP